MHTRPGPKDGDGPLGVNAVQVAGRWTSAQMPAHHARGELASKGAVARFPPGGLAR